MCYPKCPRSASRSVKVFWLQSGRHNHLVIIPVEWSHSNDQNCTVWCGGEMGVRSAVNLLNTGFEVAQVEISEAGQSRLKAETGKDCVPAGDALKRGRGCVAGSTRYGDQGCVTRHHRQGRKRRAAPFFQFDDFRDQIEFAKPSRALNDRVKALVDVPGGVGPGDRVQFVGVTSLKSAEDAIVMTPIEVEFVQ